MTIPPAAMPVILLLRAHVPRPETLPKYVDGNGLRWEGYPCFCPVMMLSKLIYVHGKAFWDFVAWWDSLLDAEPAVDAIWEPAMPARK